jgi:hypothetical protein
LRVRALLRWRQEALFGVGDGGSIGTPWIRWYAGVVALQEGERRDLVATLFAQCEQVVNTQEACESLESRFGATVPR